MSLTEGDPEGKVALRIARRCKDLNFQMQKHLENLPRLVANTFSFHGVGVSEHLQIVRSPRDVIYFLKAMTNRL